MAGNDWNINIFTPRHRFKDDSMIHLDRTNKELDYPGPGGQVVDRLKNVSPLGPGGEHKPISNKSKYGRRAISVQDQDHPVTRHEAVRNMIAGTNEDAYNREAYGHKAGAGTESTENEPPDTGAHDRLDSKKAPGDDGPKGPPPLSMTRRKGGTPGTTLTKKPGISTGGAPPKIPAPKRTPPPKRAPIPPYTGPKKPGRGTGLKTYARQMPNGY